MEKNFEVITVVQSYGDDLFDTNEENVFVYGNKYSVAVIKYISDDDESIKSRKNLAHRSDLTVAIETFFYERAYGRLFSL